MKSPPAMFADKTTPRAELPNQSRRQFVTAFAVVGLMLAAPVLQPTVSAAAPTAATSDAPWENSIGMKFAPVTGTNLLFSIWETRVQDFEAFVQATKYD